MELQEIVPLGRGLGDYAAMFALQPADRARSVLGCGDGPAAFNADWTRRGGRVVSLDPLYAQSGEAIAARIDATFPEVVRQMRRAPERLRLAPDQTVDRLAARRRAAMRRFRADYSGGGRDGRYVAGALPDLPFAAGAFDLAVVSHLLFLYDRQLDLDAHVAGLTALLRVAAEVRVFPLVDLAGQRSRWLDPALAHLRGRGVRADILAVDYEVQRGARQMLRLSAPD
jgi:hypothetical protein